MIEWKLKKLFDFGKTQDFFFCYTDVVKMIKEINLLNSIGNNCFHTIEDFHNNRYLINSVEEYLDILENGFE